MTDMGTAKDSVNLRAQIRASLETTTALYKDSMAVVKSKKLQELSREDQTLYARITKQLESAVKEHEQLKIAFMQKEKSLPKPGSFVDFFASSPIHHRQPLSIGWACRGGWL